MGICGRLCATHRRVSISNPVSGLLQVHPLMVLLCHMICAAAREPQLRSSVSGHTRWHVAMKHCIETRHPRNVRKS